MAKKQKERVFFITPVFRMSFPNLFKPVAGPDGGDKKKFGVSAAFGPRKKMSKKDQKRWDFMMSELDRVSNEWFGVDWEELGTGKFKAVKTGLRDNSEKDGMDGYQKGGMFANLTTERRPNVCNKDKEELSLDDDNTDEIYAGCYGRAKVSVFGYDGKGKGVAIGLSSVMKAGDGDPLGSGGGDAKDDFEDDDFDDEDYDTGSSDDDDEDERPKKKSKKSRDDEDEDDEDERPKKKRSRDEDEDDEEDDEPRKKKKKRSRDEDEDDED